jgi:nucleoside-diphosphate-sugar epimerase
MKKVLIIGGNGYVGSRLINDYKEIYEMAAIDNTPLDKDISFAYTYFCDFNELDENFYSNYDVIILLAGHSSVKMCEGNVEHAFNNNVRNFVNLINKLKPHHKFIYASSSSVYGNVGKKIVTEKYHNFVPHNHYDVTKHMIDLYADKIPCEYYGLRFGTVNGASPVVRKDVMINSMTYNALNDGEVKLYIKDIIRPILGINDLSRAIKTIINSDKDNRGIYNLASFNETAENIAYGVSKITGIPVKEYETDPTNITNAKLQTKSYNFSIDSSKFMKTFNFEFEETIESITKSLVTNFKDIIFTDRNQPKEYE